MSGRALHVHVGKLLKKTPIKLKSTYKVDVVYPRFSTLDGPSIFSIFFVVVCVCGGGGGGMFVCLQLHINASRVL